MKFDKVVKARATRGHIPKAAGTDATYWVVLGFSEAAVRWYVLGWLDRYTDHYEAFALADPTVFPEFHGSVPASVPAGEWKKCRDAVRALVEHGERVLSTDGTESYDAFLARNVAEVNAAADTVLRADFCRAEEGADVARVLGMVMLGRMRWTGRWEEALVQADGSKGWMRTAGAWNRLLHDLERNSRRIVLSADGVAVLRIDDPPPDDHVYVFVPRCTS